MAFDNIEKPTEFLGVKAFARSNGQLRNPFDAAHGFGDSLWAEEMRDRYQARLDPDGKFLFNADARYNGCLVSHREVDAAVLGTTAHGNHSGSVNELQWSSNPANPSFAQSILKEYNNTAVDLQADLADGLINQAEYDHQINEARISAIKDHIAFTKTMEAGYLRQDLLDAAGHSDMVLLHGGSPKGAERIAACWADARKVAQVVFKPDWARHRNAAPFKRNDRMLEVLPIGLVAFPGSGISENLADKARKMGIPVWRFGAVDAD